MSKKRMSRRRVSLLTERIKKKVRNYRSWNRNDYAVAVCAVMGFIVVTAAAAFVVRAFLTDFTQMRKNEFASMTYTNINIVEPSNHDYSVNFSFNTATGTYDNNNGLITKDAEIKNASGSDKKPVYLRAKVIMTVYDSKGYNITMLYANGQSNGVALEDLPYDDPDQGDWTKGKDGYYYYNRILLPGDSTVKLFDQNKVTVRNAVNLPSGSVIHVDILADAIQAVSTDSSRWKTADFYKESSLNEVETAWGFRPVLPSTSDPLPDNGENYYYSNGAWHDISLDGIAELLESKTSISCKWSSVAADEDP